MVGIRRVLGIVALCLLAGGGFARAAVSGPPLEINVILSLSGSGTFQGAEQKTALGLLEGIINADGGVRGRPVKFVLEDDTSNPQVAVQLANALIAKNMPAILGPALTSTCKAVMALTMKSGPVTYCVSPGVHPDAGSFAYSSSVSARDQLVTIVRYLRLRGLTRLAMITSTDATGQDVDESVHLALQRPENASVQLVAQEHFNQSDISVVAQMTRIKAAAATAAQIHDYIAQLHDWGGAQGLYDFRTGDQRGLGTDATLVDRWDPNAKDFFAASAPQGQLK